jgi:hypothetical protein
MGVGSGFRARACIPGNMRACRVSSLDFLALQPATPHGIHHDEHIACVASLRQTEDFARPHGQKIGDQATSFLFTPLLHPSKL